jgi:hypothetical protein
MVSPAYIPLENRVTLRRWMCDARRPPARAEKAQLHENGDLQAASFWLTAIGASKQ